MVKMNQRLTPAHKRKFCHFSFWCWADFIDWKPAWPAPSRPTTEPSLLFTMHVWSRWPRGVYFWPTSNSREKTDVSKQLKVSRGKPSPFPEGADLGLISPTKLGGRRPEGDNSDISLCHPHFTVGSANPTGGNTSAETSRVSGHCSHRW